MCALRGSFENNFSLGGGNVKVIAPGGSMILEGEITLRGNYLPRGVLMLSITYRIWHRFVKPRGQL